MPEAAPNEGVIPVQQLNGSLTRDQERLKLAEYKVRRLAERLRLIRLNKYGPGSETLSDAQLELLEVEPGVSAAEVAAEGQRKPLALRPAKPARPHPGREQLPPELPRVERLIACPGAGRRLESGSPSRVAAPKSPAVAGAAEGRPRGSPGRGAAPERAGQGL
ncbi:MAG: transposase [Verrucomicrobia bacterium]|nr:transposase [Verrucomicrobiota bacterium]